MTDTLRGKDYRALRRVSDGDNQTLAAVGETCERVPASGLAWLLARGAIERNVERRTTTRPPAPAGKRTTREKR